jgi:hypothetical protein
MGPANPWSPNWRPDPTGRRLAAIRAARWGAFLAALLLWPLTLLATLTTPGSSEQPVARAVLIAALAWPGLALLGAGLAPAAIGSRVDAVVAGVALAIGTPVAAVTSMIIGAVVVLVVSGAHGQAGEAVGAAIRLGVQGAVRVAPLLAIATVIWVLLVRRVAARAAPVEGGTPDEDGR